MIKTSIFVIAQALINSHLVLFFPCYNFASIFHSLRKSRFSSFDSHPLISLARSPWKIECINLSIFSYLPYLKIERDRTMVKFCQDQSIYTRSHIRKYKEIILNQKRGKGNKKKDKKNVIKTVIHSSTNHPGQRNQCTKYRYRIYHLISFTTNLIEDEFEQSIGSHVVRIVVTLHGPIHDALSPIQDYRRT